MPSNRGPRPDYARVVIAQDFAVEDICGVLTLGALRRQRVHAVRTDDSVLKSHVLIASAKRIVKQEPSDGYAQTEADS